MSVGTSMRMQNAAVTVLAVSSGGGHWLQLCRVAEAFEGTRLITACTVDGPAMPTIVHRHHRLRDATRWNRWGLLVLGQQVARLTLRERPDVVVTTGAAPGLWALLWGRMIGARTVWIDSLANVEQLSAAGRLARWVATDWWTQWPHLAAPPDPQSAADHANSQGTDGADSLPGHRTWHPVGPSSRERRARSLGRILGPRARARSPQYRGAVW